MLISNEMLWRTCLLLVTVTLATAADCSTSQFNFFPSNRINIPGGWNKANQTRAGNVCDGHLLPIAVQGIPKPLLHFTPVHHLLVLGSDVPGEDAPSSSSETFAIQQEGANAAAFNPPTASPAAAQPAATATAAAAAAAGVIQPAAATGAAKPSTNVRVTKQPLPAAPAAAATKATAAGSAQLAASVQATEPAATAAAGVAKPATSAAQPAQKLAAAVAGIAGPAISTNAAQQTVVVKAANPRNSTRPMQLATAQLPQMVPVTQQTDMQQHGTVQEPVQATEQNLLPQAEQLPQQAVEQHTLQGAEQQQLEQYASMQQPAAELKQQTAQQLQQLPQANGAEQLLQQQLQPQQQQQLIGEMAMRKLLVASDSMFDEFYSHTGVAGSVSGQKRSKGSPSSAGNAYDNTATRMRQAKATKAAGKLMVGKADLWTVAVPAQYQFNVQVNGKLWFTSKTLKASDIAEVNFNANITEGRRDVFDPEIFKEGINTVVITVTILKGTGIITNGYNASHAPSQDETFSSPPIDFYFFMTSNETHDSRPSADFKLNNCAPDLSIQLSNTSPPPVLLDGYHLTYIPTPTSQAFFLPVYYMYGSFLEGLDGSTDMQSDNTEGNVKNFGVYVTRLPGSPTSFNVSVPQLSMLKEGWYSSTVEGAIWSPNSQFDNLMSVAGADKFGNKRADYLSVTAGGIVTDSISLYGGFKGAGWVLPEYNKTLVGIQRRPTWLNYFQGPETALTLGEKATFYWEFSGLGNASCKINGVDPGVCASPLVYPIVTTLNQTLVVEYNDVCDATHTVEMTFGTFGWEVDEAALSAANVLGSSSVMAMSDKGELAARRNSTSAADLKQQPFAQVLLLAFAACLLLLTV